MQRHLPEESPKYPQGQGRVAKTPCAPIRLVAARPKPFSEQPQTLGEHIKGARHVKGITQTEAARQIGVTQFTIIHWEKDRTTPPVRAWPALLSWLGYDPHPNPQTLSERLRALRRGKGLTLREASELLAIDLGTLGQWERGLPIAWPRYRDLVERFLAAHGF